MFIGHQKGRNTKVRRPPPRALAALFLVREPARAPNLGPFDFEVLSVSSDVHCLACKIGIG